MFSSQTLSTSAQTKVLFVFTFVHQFISVLYSMFGIEPYQAFHILGWIGGLWIFCWWLSADSKRAATTWPLDMGYFLSVAWLLIIPYHLFRTRGLKLALIGTFAYIGMIVAGWLSAILVGHLFFG